MEKNEIKQLIVETLSSYLESQDIKIDINVDTVLFGENAVLDSMGLVNIVIDLESTFLDKGFEISLTSENAMSRSRSPFRNVLSLAEFIKEQVN